MHVEDSIQRSALLMKNCTFKEAIRATNSYPYVSKRANRSLKIIFICICNQAVIYNRDAGIKRSNADVIFLMKARKACCRTSDSLCARDMASCRRHRRSACCPSAGISVSPQKKKKSTPYHIPLLLMSMSPSPHMCRFDGGRIGKHLIQNKCGLS